MTPSEVHAIHQTPTQAAPALHSPPALLPSGSSAALMLTLGVAAAEGLYAVGKTVATRLTRSTPTQEEKELPTEKENEEEDTKQLPINPELLTHKSHFYPVAEEEAELSHQESSHSFRNWEESTIQRIERAKLRRLETGKQSVDAVEAWYRATVGRYRAERERRVRKLREEKVRAWVVEEMRGLVL